MKIELTDLSPVKKGLFVEVGADVVAEESEAVLRRYARQVRLPGFRPGKAPAEMVRKRFAKEIADDVRERLISRLWRDATAEKGLRPLGDPVLEELSDEPGKPFSIKTSFEVLPSFTVKDYKGVDVRKASASVEEAEVDAALESIRQGHARYVADEARLAEPGDVLVADVTETAEGEEPKTRERMVLEVGAEDNPKELNERVAGAKAGAVLDATVVYPDDHPGEGLRGKTVRYDLEVHEVKRKEIPPLDDELAKDLGDFANVAALRERVRKDLEERKEAQVRAALRQSVLDKVLLANPVPLPEILVDEEIQHRLEDVVREMMFHGIDPRKAELDWKEMRDRQDEPARKIVHARLVLDAIAAAEGVTVERAEVDDRVRREAARLKKGGGLQALETQLVREKSLDLITSIANISGAE
jgi:trigger factor